MTKEQFEAITAWQKETLEQATPLLKITTRLKQEVTELEAEILLGKVTPNTTQKRLEFAACFLLLFGAAHADGMSYEDICAAIDEKIWLSTALASGANLIPTEW